jgi:hypothetical protein
MFVDKSTSWNGFTGLEGKQLSCHQAKEKEPFGSISTPC